MSTAPMDITDCGDIAVIPHKSFFLSVSDMARLYGKILCWSVRLLPYVWRTASNAVTAHRCYFATAMALRSKVRGLRRAVA